MVDCRKNVGYRKIISTIEKLSNVEKLSKVEKLSNVEQFSTTKKFILNNAVNYIHFGRLNALVYLKCYRHNIIELKLEKE